LKILHIDTGREMRGGQWQALYLASGLTARGHRVRMLAPAGSPLLLAAQAQRLDAKPLHIPLLLTGAGDADLVHAHDARSHTLALMCRKPVVVSRRVAFPVRRTLASRLKYERASRYIAVSQYVRYVLVDGGVPAEKISVVYDGVPVGQAPIRSEHRITALALDSDDPGKGKKIIEEAAALADIPICFSRNLVRDLPDAAVFVYITDLEGFGSAVLLAMAAGTPVLASRVGGTPEAIEDGESGLLTSNEPPAVAAGLRRLLDDRKFAQLLAARARARVERCFPVERMVNETVGVYERVLC
jgi:hypothetical protein